MKQNYVTLILILLLINTSFAQVNIKSKNIEAANSVKEELNSKFQNYTLFEINLKKFQLLLKDQNKNSVNLEIDGKKYEMFLYAKDIRGKNFTEFWSGKKRQPAQNITFRGELKNGDFVRLTLTDNFIYGIIKIDTGYLVIDQLKSVTKNKKIDPNHLIAYKTSGLIEDEGVCGTVDSQSSSLNNEMTTLSTSTECLILEVATDADFEYFQDHGNNSNNRILGEFNNIQGVYADTFDMEIIVVYQNVWENSNDPYSSTDSATIINEINDTWNTDFSNVDRDLVHLFTGKNLGSNLGRASGIGTVCNQIYSSSYTKDRASAFRTLGHEIGHNLGGIHGDGINCGTSTASVMCQGEKQIPIYFSNNSISRIQSYISSNSNCLTIFNNIEIVGENAICDNSSESYTLETPLGGQITWSISNSSLASIISGQGTDSITIEGSGTGTFILTAGIDVDGTVCGEETMTKQIHVGKPYADMSSPPIVCTNQFSELYTVPASEGAESYRLVSSSPYLTIGGHSEITTTSAPFMVNFLAYQEGSFLVELFTTNSCGTSRGAIYVTAENCTGGPGGPGGLESYVVYPNPASKEVSIENTSQEKGTEASTFAMVNPTAQLYDFNGTPVKTIELERDNKITRLDVSNFKEGLYFLKIMYGNNVETHKIIVAR